MSRIGKTPIALPQGVDVKIDGSHVAVKGPKGALTVPFVDDVGVNLEGDTVQVTCDSQEKGALSSRSNAHANRKCSCGRQ